MKLRKMCRCDRILFCRSMHPLIRFVWFIILALVSSGGAAPSQPVSGSPAKPTPAPTPIPLARVPWKRSLPLPLSKRSRRACRGISQARRASPALSDLTSEIDARIADETRLLRSSPWHRLFVPGQDPNRGQARQARAQYAASVLALLLRKKGKARTLRLDLKVENGHGSTIVF
jgi:hypothetical protein